MLAPDERGEYRASSKVCFSRKRPDGRPISDGGIADVDVCSADKPNRIRDEAADAILCLRPSLSLHRSAQRSRDCIPLLTFQQAKRIPADEHGLRDVHPRTSCSCSARPLSRDDGTTRRCRDLSLKLTRNREQDAALYGCWLWVLSFFFPPVAVFLERGCGTPSHAVPDTPGIVLRLSALTRVSRPGWELLLNFVLSCIAWLPGMVHALSVFRSHLPSLSEASDQANAAARAVTSPAG